MNKSPAFTPPLQPRSRASKHEGAGFTLIELLVVVGIIGILAAVIAPNAFRAIEKAKIASAVSTAKAVKSAVYAYYTDTGRWPPDEPGTYVVRLDRLLQDDGTPGWDGPYLEAWKRFDSYGARDPWGGRLEIRNEEGWASDSFGINPSTIDILLVFNNSGVIDVPDPSIQRIDTILDDGNVTTGDVIASCGPTACEIRIGLAAIGTR